jgi:Raf kinase inhibitor-like YbhB/YbcL family protein
VEYKESMMGSVVGSIVAGVLISSFAAAAAEGGESMQELSLTSAAFAHQGEIPRKFTCEGDDVSPPLAWATLPEGTKSLALIVDDPDAPDPKAPRMTWVHWVLYNIPAAVAGLPEGVKAEALPAGTQQGQNDWRRTGYGGPCPPIGRHRYFHKLYALDTVLAGLRTPTKAELEKVMRGHILAEAVLIGTYAKAGSD